MIESISFKKIFQARSFSTETSMIPSMRTREIERMLLRKESKPLLSLTNKNLKITETNTLKRCWRMPPSSKNSPPKRMKKPETSKRQLLTSLRLITSTSMKSWTDTDLSWKVKLPKQSSSKRKSKDKQKIMKKS